MNITTKTKDIKNQTLTQGCIFGLTTNLVRNITDEATKEGKNLTQL